MQQIYLLKKAAQPKPTNSERKGVIQKIVIEIVLIISLSNWLQKGPINIRAEP